MSHGDRKKRKIAEKQRANSPPPSKGRCALCGKDARGECPQSPNGHIVL